MGPRILGRVLPGPAEVKIVSTCLLRQELLTNKDSHGAIFPAACNHPMHDPIDERVSQRVIEIYSNELGMAKNTAAFGIYRIVQTWNLQWRS
jgi:hypothetical protein